MPMITFVLGLAGSGKSKLIPWLQADHVVEEDFAAHGQWQQNHDELVRRLRLGQHCVISELKFFQKSARDQYVATLRTALQPAILQINWLCFDRDLDSANWNCLHRNNKPNDPTGERHVDMNNRNFRHYEIPDGAIVFKIMRWPFTDHT